MQFFRKYYQRLVLLVFASMLVACSASQRVVKTYEGPSLPESQLARLEVREDIKIIEIDGVRQKTYLLDNLALTYSLLPGEHTIVYQYSSIWSRAKRSSDTEESRVDLIQSDLRQVRMVFQPAKTYFFSFPEPSDKREAAKLAKQFSAIIVDENTVKIAGDSAVEARGAGIAQSPSQRSSAVSANPSDAEALTSRKGIVGSGGAIAGNVSPNGSTVSESGVAVVPRSSPVQTVVPFEAGLSRLDAIKVLWTKASAEEKKEFLRWAFQ